MSGNWQSLRKRKSCRYVGIGYGYDYASNSTWKQATLTGAKDELYQYDGLHRLKDSSRGTLNTGKTGIDGTAAREETYTLDAPRNWKG